MKWNQRGYLCLAGATVGTLVVAAGNVLFPPATQAEATTGGAPASTEIVMADPVHASASRVFVDPETGAFGGPTAAQLVTLREATAKATSRSDEGLEIVRHKDGAESVNLMGRFQHASIVTMTDDGIHHDCVTGTTACDHAHDTEVK